MTYRIIDRRGQDAPGSPPGRGEGVGSPSAWVGTSLFATPRTTAQEDYYRPRPSPWANTCGLYDYDWLELVNFSRQLFAQNSNIAYAIAQKAEYAVGDGWRPHYTGRNPKWGQEYEEWLMHEWYPNASLCGQFDFRTELELSSMAWDMDGDDAVIFVMDENNQPRLKLIEALQIGGSTSRAGSTARAASSGDTVKGGPYDGARIVNGVVLDRDDQFIGIQLKGSARGSRASSGGSPEDDSEIIPAYNCQLSFEPEFRFLHRGVPRIGKAMLDVFDGDDIDAFLKKAVKRLASFGVKIKTETGDAGPGGDLIVARPDNGTGDFIPPNDVKVEKIMGGEAYYMRANSGEDIEALKHDQPHPNTEAFVMRLERRAMLALRWFHELLDPSRIGGASVRLIQNQARTAIAKRQRTLKIRAKRCVQFAVAARMNSGQGSKNNDGADFLRWGFNMPPQLTVDQGYDELADQENFDLGSETLSSLCEKKGKWWLDRRGQKETENKDLIDRASVLVAYAKTKGQSLTFAEALDLMQRKNQTGRQRPAEADNPSPQTS